MAGKFWRAFGAGTTALFLELPVTGTVSQKFTSNFSLPGASGNVSSMSNATYFVTPGLRLRFLNKRLSPYAAAGFGLESTKLSEMRFLVTGGLVGFGPSGTRNYKGAFDFAGGLDVRVQRHLSLRGEFRDFVRTGKASNESGTTVVAQDALPSRHMPAFLGGVAVRF